MAGARNFHRTEQVYRLGVTHWRLGEIVMARECGNPNRRRFRRVSTNT